MSKLIECRQQVFGLLHQLETLEAGFMAAKEFRNRILDGEREFDHEELGVVLQVADRALPLPAPSAEEMAMLLESAAATQSDMIRSVWESIGAIAGEALAHYQAAAAQAANSETAVPINANG